MDLQDDGRINWWLKDDDTQNFGDFLGYVISKAIFTQPVRDHCSYRMLGSAIADWDINQDLARADGEPDRTIGFWCCGVRTEAGVSDESRERLAAYGVRGPLTRDVLGLPADTPLGDPGLIAPIVYTPTVRDDLRSKTICVPHFLDTCRDADLLQRTGADLIVRPNIARTERAVFDLIDAIASASFVLAGSLHAAIVACAYDVPFGYLDTGFVDIPFKWRDFSALVGIGTSFCDRVADARTIYEQVNRTRLRKPALLPMLAVAPFRVRLDILLKAYHHDMQHRDSASTHHGELLNALLRQGDYSLLALAEAVRDPVAQADKQASIGAEPVELPTHDDVGQPVGGTDAAMVKPERPEPAIATDETGSEHLDPASAHPDIPEAPPEAATLNAEAAAAGEPAMAPPSDAECGEAGSSTRDA
ncbi:hypothetical protein U8607_20060 [Methylobacterium durans]|uniref:hypothetical protein n=1 Tax=Methylobacterium durans TaxID=2202825 RepID=UPI002AFDCB36|nr:hypothetical protein [Methylobacterium durans]MEA1834391.1 hypothetical protein [Methylobacterium durans]